MKKLTEATIDIGTNTMLMLVAEVAPAPKAGAPRTIERVISDHQTIVRLGQGVHQNRRFVSEAMERALNCFKNYRKIADEAGVQTIRAVATSASRDSANAREFYGRVRNETGIDVKIIKGETEARLSFLGGLLPFQDPKKSALIDIGGGSTEFVALNPQGTDVHGQSLDMGCVRATEMFLQGDPYTKESVEALEKNLKAMWSQIEPSLQKEIREKEWTAIAGTPTTLAAMAQKLTKFESEKVDGYRMDRCQIGDWFESLAIQRQADRAANPLMGPGRADVMVAGVGILLTAMEHFEKPEIIVSSRGLRHGIMLKPDEVS